MKTLLPVLALLLILSACKKEPPPEPEPPAQTESVPISNDPRNGAAMIRAASGAAERANAAARRHQAEMNAGLEEQ